MSTALFKKLIPSGSSCELLPKDEEEEEVWCSGKWVVPTKMGKTSPVCSRFYGRGDFSSKSGSFFLRPNLSSYPRKSWRKIKPFFCFSLFQTPFHLRLTLIVQQHAAANSQNMSSIVITRRLNVSTVKEFTRLRMSGEG